jgi:hypothetical protein
MTKQPVHPFSRVYLSLPEKPGSLQFPELLNSVPASPLLADYLDSQYIDYQLEHKKPIGSLRRLFTTEDTESDYFLSVVVSYPMRVTVTIDQLFGNATQLPINVTLVYSSQESYQRYVGNVWHKLVWGTENLILEN